MRAARLYGARDVRIDEVPLPRPAPGEVLVRVRTVSICPSDWRMYADGHAGGVVPDHAMIQGHEFSGDVAELGSGVAGPAVGARVAVEPSWPCGECDMCRAGRGNICRRVRFPSFPPTDGALAEHIACPASAVCALPDEVSYVEGALVEPLGVSLHAVGLARLAATETVAVLGAGVIGMGVLYLARAAGVRRLAVVEPVAERREWPRRLGVETVVADCGEALDAGVEADVVFECSGDNAGLDQAVRLARAGGRVVVVGIPHAERVTFDASIARRRELALLYSRRSHGALPECVRLLAARQVDFHDIPVRTFPLEATRDALELTGHPGSVLRAVVIP